MQFLATFLASASVVFANVANVQDAASSPSATTLPSPNWCNHGWAGNGNCEKDGLRTYC
ncbi:hypothetical protein E4U58_001172, partial [Claviceps cyperi]